MSTTPADWYDDGTGILRYWDGEAWTEHTHDPNAAAAEPVAAQAPAAMVSVPTYAPPQQFAPGQFSGRPPFALDTSRGLLKYILLVIVTFGIYELYIFTKMTSDLNTITTRSPVGKRHTNYLVMLFLLGPLTFGIYWAVWGHNFSKHVGIELRRRNLTATFGASDYWLCNVLLGVFVIGKFIFMYRLFQAMNALSADYNQRGA